MISNLINLTSHPGYTSSHLSRSKLARGNISTYFEQKSDKTLTVRVTWCPGPVATKAGSWQSCNLLKLTPGSRSHDTVRCQLALTSPLAAQRCYQHSHQNSLHHHFCCLLTNLGHRTIEGAMLFFSSTSVSIDRQKDCCAWDVAARVNVARRSMR